MATRKVEIAYTVWSGGLGRAGLSDDDNENNNSNNTGNDSQHLLSAYYESDAHVNPHNSV